MIAPSAMYIEAASFRLEHDDEYVNSHLKILDEQTDEVQNALPGKSSDFYAGYCLGVETARVMLAGMPSAVKAGVTI